MQDEVYSTEVKHGFVRITRTELSVAWGGSWKLSQITRAAPKKSWLLGPYVQLLYESQAIPGLNVDFPGEWKIHCKSYEQAQEVAEKIREAAHLR